MSRTPGLSLYLFALSEARSRAQGKVPPADPPEGPRLWMHAGSAGRPAVELARRIRESGVVRSVIVTGVAGPPATPGLTFAAPPEVHGPGARDFLDRWSPDCILLTGPFGLSHAVHEATDRGIPILLAEASVPARALRGLRFFPGAGPALFAGVARILAVDAASVSTFAGLGAPALRIERSGPLIEGPLPPGCLESERAALVDLLAARPVWCGDRIALAEWPTILKAHRRATGGLHRLLLIAVPADPAQGAAFRDRAAEDGWRVSLRSEGAEPTPDAQIYVADTEGEEGLWYRLAPLTFLGNSLESAGPVPDPYGPAALGSAILCGPVSGAHRDTIDAFVRARAARRIATGDQLGDAVSQLLSPDLSAEFARNAWELISSGAEVTDRIITLVADAVGTEVAA